MKDVLSKKVSKNFISVDKTEKDKDILQLMKANDISQLPVSQGDEMIGSITESKNT